MTATSTDSLAQGRQSTAPAAQTTFPLTLGSSDQIWVGTVTPASQFGPLRLIDILAMVQAASGAPVLVHQRHLVVANLVAGLRQRGPLPFGPQFPAARGGVQS